MSSTTAPACISKPSLLAQPGARGRIARTPAFRLAAPRQVIVRAEDPKQEDLKAKAKEPVNKGGSAYIDDLPVRSLERRVLYAYMSHFPLNLQHCDLRACSVFAAPSTK